MTRRCPRCGHGIRGPMARASKRRKQLKTNDHICKDCRNAELIDQLEKPRTKVTQVDDFSDLWRLFE